MQAMHLPMTYIFALRTRGHAMTRRGSDALSACMLWAAQTSRLMGWSD